MPIFDATNSIKLAGRTPTRGEASTFGENFAASIEAFAESQQFVSKQANTMEETQKILNELGQRGVSPQKMPQPPMAGDPTQQRGQTLDQQVEQFFADVRAIGEENPELIEGLPTSEGELNQVIAQEAAEAAREREEVAFRASTLGQLGQFAGTATGAVTDPPVLASLFLGAPASAGILRTIATEAAVGAGTEVPIQAGVQSTRAELGLESGTQRALENIAAAGIGGGLFAGAVQGAARGVGAIRGRARERALAKRLQQRQERQQQAEAFNVVETARKVREQQPERYENDPTVKSAVNTSERIGEIQEQNPFPKDVPSADRVFNETFDAVLRTVQESGRIPNVRTTLPTDVTTPISRIEDNLPDPANTARRGAGRDGFDANNAASLLGQRLRETAQARGEDENAVEGIRKVIGRVVDETPNKEELGRTLKSANQLADRAEEIRRGEQNRENLTKGQRSALTRKRNQFIRDFQTRFPEASEQEAINFIKGTNDLRAAVETLREAGGDIAGSRTGAGILELEPTQISNTLREFLAPLQEQQAVGRSLNDIQTRRSQTEKMAEELDTQIQRLRQFAQDDVDGNMTIRTVDDEGNDKVTDVKNVLKSLDEDEKLNRALEDCVGGTRSQ